MWYGITVDLLSKICCFAKANFTAIFKNENVTSCNLTEKYENNILQDKESFLEYIGNKRVWKSFGSCWHVSCGWEGKSISPRKNFSVRLTGQILFSWWCEMEMASFLSHCFCSGPWHFHFLEGEKGGGEGLYNFRCVKTHQAHRHKLLSSLVF